jgi:hypothetical protein
MNHPIGQASFVERVRTFSSPHTTPGEKALGEAVSFVAGVALGAGRLRPAIEELLLASPTVTWSEVHACGALLETEVCQHPRLGDALRTAHRCVPHVLDGTFPEERASFPTATVRPLFDLSQP